MRNVRTISDGKHYNYGFLAFAFISTIHLSANSSLFFTLFFLLPMRSFINHTRRARRTLIFFLVCHRAARIYTGDDCALTVTLQCWLKLGDEWYGTVWGRRTLSVDPKPDSTVNTRGCFSKNAKPKLRQMLTSCNFTPHYHTNHRNYYFRKAVCELKDFPKIKISAAPKVGRLHISYSRMITE